MGSISTSIEEILDFCRNYEGEVNLPVDFFTHLLEAEAKVSLLKRKKSFSRKTQLSRELFEILEEVRRTIFDATIVDDCSVREFFSAPCESGKCIYYLIVEAMQKISF